MSRVNRIRKTNPTSHPPPGRAKEDIFSLENQYARYMKLLTNLDTKEPTESDPEEALRDSWTHTEASRGWK